MCEHVFNVSGKKYVVVGFSLVECENLQAVKEFLDAEDPSPELVNRAIVAYRYIRLRYRTLSEIGPVFREFEARLAAVIREKGVRAWYVPRPASVFG